MFQRVLLDFVLKTFGLGAENETRTRDPNLGKVVLYQLSYFRIESEEEETRTPTPRGTATSKQRVYHSATSPFLNHKVSVPKTGVEPARLSTHAPETCASTNSATWANMERKTRLELATPTLARLCSTN